MPVLVGDEAKVKPATVGQESCRIRMEMLHTLDVGRHGGTVVREQLGKTILLVRLNGECKCVVDPFRSASHEVGRNHPFRGMPSPDVRAEADLGFEFQGGLKRLIYRTRIQQAVIPLPNPAPASLHRSRYLRMS